MVMYFSINTGRVVSRVSGIVCIPVISSARLKTLQNYHQNILCLYIYTYIYIYINYTLVTCYILHSTHPCECNFSFAYVIYRSPWEVLPCKSNCMAPPPPPPPFAETHHWSVVVIFRNVKFRQRLKEGVSTAQCN